MPKLNSDPCPSARLDEQVELTLSVRLPAVCTRLQFLARLQLAPPPATTSATHLRAHSKQQCRHRLLRVCRMSIRNSDANSDARCHHERNYCGWKKVRAQQYEVATSQQTDIYMVPKSTTPFSMMICVAHDKRAATFRVHGAFRQPHSVLGTC